MISQSVSKTSTRQKLKFNKESKPLNNLKLPQDMEILSLQISDSGQSGVIFIETRDGSFLLKSTPEVPSALFFNKLAKLLEIPVPQIQYFSYEDKEYKRLWSAIEKFVKTKDECLLARLANKFDFCLYQIIQYVHSIEFPSATSQQFQKEILIESNLQAMGSCLAFDMILNNNDRFPFLWGGFGNLDNILIAYDKREKGPQNLVFIDNHGNFSDVQNPSVMQNVQRYLDKIKKIFTFLVQQQKNGWVQDTVEKSIYIKKLIDQIKLYTGHDLTCQQVATIFKSTIKLTRNFLDAFKMGKIHTILQQISEQPLRKTMGKFCEEQWQKDLSKVHMSFCKLYYEIVSDILRADLTKQQIH